MSLLKSNVFKTAFKALVSVTLLFLIFRLIGFEEIYAALLGMNFNYILVSLMFVLLLMLVKSIRWRNIASTFKAYISLADSVNYTFISFAFGFITPGRVGEFIKSKYLADKAKAGYFRSFLTVVIDKIFDLAALLGLVFLGTLFLDINSPFSDLFIFPFILYTIILILIFLFFDEALKFAKFLIPRKYKDDLKLLRITRRFYLASLGLSFLIWFFLSVAGFFILKALDASEISLLIAIIVVPLMALSSQLPISLGGIGVREVVAIYALSFIGIAAEKSIVFSLIYTFVSLGIPAIIGVILYIKSKNK